MAHFFAFFQKMAKLTHGAAVSGSENGHFSRYGGVPYRHGLCYYPVASSG
jgi:hypothetical protein